MALFMSTYNCLNLLSFFFIPRQLRQWNLDSATEIIYFGVRKLINSLLVAPIAEIDRESGTFYFQKKIFMEADGKHEEILEHWLNLVKPNSDTFLNILLFLIDMLVDPIFE